MNKINISYLVQQNEESELIDVDLIKSSLYDIKYFIREEKINTKMIIFVCFYFIYLILKDIIILNKKENKKKWNKS